METVIHAQGLCKSYRMGLRDLSVLRGIDLAVAEGERLAIMGPSGAGKSTLLHLLGGLDQPTAGKVIFKGQDLYALSPGALNEIRAKNVGFVFQSFHLLPELDIVENVMLPAMAERGVWRKAGAVRDRAMQLLSDVGLSGRTRHTPLELSGGEQQRVALARALMNEPEVLLADEPTGNLDTATGGQVLNCLFALTQRMRHTLILVTHNAELATRCDRTIHLVDGEIRP